MRILLWFLLAPILCSAASSDEDQILAAINGLFSAMAAHSADGVQTFLTEDARAIAVRDDKVVRLGREELAKAVTSSKSDILERIWNPKVLVRGRIATVWAEYDFHLDGKFHHCGIDTFLMLKTDDGWKITSLEWTAEISGCAPSPLGPPKK